MIEARARSMLLKAIAKRSMVRIAQSLVVWTDESESEAARHEATIHHVVMHSDAMDSERVTAAKMKSDSYWEL